MKNEKYFLGLALIMIINVLKAQPDENYIKRITSSLNSEKIISLNDSLPPQDLEWKLVTAPNFKKYSDDSRKQALLAHGWQLYPHPIEGTNSYLQAISLPHDFERNRNYYAASYLNKFKLEIVPETRYVLKLNRVQQFSTVYVNGKRISHHFGGYTPFEVDITDALISGDNILSIYVHDQSASVDGKKLYNQVATTRLARFGKPGSSYRLPGGIHDIPVLEMRTTVFIKDVFVKTSTRNKEIEIEFELPSTTDPTDDLSVSFELLKWPDGAQVNLEIPDILSPEIIKGVNTHIVKWEDPQLWSPDHPNLYVLRSILHNGNKRDVLDTRFGFREFWIDGKTFMLNGIPTRLRGESHYHPMRYGVDFHREVFKTHKELFGSNTCRVHAFMPPGDIMLGADEAGMLIIDQSAIWSVNGQFYANGGDWLMKNTEKEFEEWARRDRNSPSVVIWDVENEMLRFNHELHLPWVSKLRGFIEKWDTTRPFNYSGGGWFSDDQDMVSLHMQEHYTRIMDDWANKDSRPLITGEFWIGGRSEQRLQNAAEIKTVDDRYIEEAKIYEERMLGMRYKEISGIMPFRISLLALKQIPHSSSQYQFTPPNSLKIPTRNKEVIERIKHALQPSTVFFWPRQTYVSANDPINREVVICNDSEQAQTFELSWNWEGKALQNKTIELVPGETHKTFLTDVAPKTHKRLIARISVQGEQISSDTLSLEPITTGRLKDPKSLRIYKDNKLAVKLSEEGFQCLSSNVLPSVEENVIWVVPEHADNRELNKLKDKILDYLHKGGNILCLKQDQVPLWFPIKFNYWPANQASLHTYGAMGWEGTNKDVFYSTEAPIYAPSHPIFSGIKSKTLNRWNPFDARVSDDVFTRPSSTGAYEPGNWRTLAGGTRRELVSLAEMFYGKGSLITCQLDIIDNQQNIQAKRLFANIINHLSARKKMAMGNSIKIIGDLTDGEISKQIESPLRVIKEALPKNNELMIAFDGVSRFAIEQWAAQGGKVIVLSRDLSSSFEGVSILGDNKQKYVASKVADHILLDGVSSANFTGDNSNRSHGYFDKVPSNSSVLLQGFISESNFWRLKKAGPVMISMPYGKGEIILSTLDMSEKLNSANKELLSLFLTNNGTKVMIREKAKAEAIAIKKTVPVKIDGQLNEWLEDMEDRLVTPYIHAQPVYLTSESVIEGPPLFDLNLSGINYFLWNEKGLHIAGVVFMDKKLFGSESYSGMKEYSEEIKYNEDIINLTFKNNTARVSINGDTSESIIVGTGKMNSKNMTDASMLQFKYVHASGRIATADAIEGETFEMIIPWGLLKKKANSKNSKLLIHLESKKSKIQVPLNGNISSMENWLNLEFKNK